MTVFPDWREPVALLRAAYERRPTPAQRVLARQRGVALAGDEPPPVVLAMLWDSLAEPLGRRLPEAASARQLDYLRALGAEAERPALAGLTRRVASAWIDHLLDREMVARLEELALRRGDLVLYRRKAYRERADLDGAEFVEETHVVSSISATGRVNFKKTHQAASGFWGSAFALERPARASWPRHVSVIARADETSSREVTRHLAQMKGAVVDGERPRHGDEPHPRRSKAMLALWARALVRLQYDDSLQILWAAIPREELTGSPTEAEDAAQVVGALGGSAPDADTVRVTLLCTESGPDVVEIVPYPLPTTPGEAVHFGIPGELAAGTHKLINSVKAVQRHRLA